MTEANISWPPLYRIKKHARAKHVKLKPVENHWLEITIPLRFNVKKIPGILEENKNWIIEHLAKARIKKTDSLPDHISLRALNQSWSIHYLECQAKSEMIIRPAQKRRAERDTDLSNKLINFIKEEEFFGKNGMVKRLILLLILPCVSKPMGSCTVQKAISLNYKPVFCRNDITACDYS